MKVLKLLRLCCITNRKNEEKYCLKHYDTYIFLCYLISIYLVKQVRAIDILHVGKWKASDEKKIIDLIGWLQYTIATDINYLLFYTFFCLHLSNTILDVVRNPDKNKSDGDCCISVATKCLNMFHFLGQNIC